MMGSMGEYFGRGRWWWGDGRSMGDRWEIDGSDGRSMGVWRGGWVEWRGGWVVVVVWG